MLRTMFLLISVALGMGVLPSAPMVINPRFFAFSSYLGPIVNLTFDDPAVMRVATTLGLGSLRYPGGTTTSYWNYSTGRWIDGYPGIYASRTRQYPPGTFTPDRYMAPGAIGSTLRAPPIWNLNLGMLRPSWVSGRNIADPPAQLDELRRMGVPVRYLELDNEAADTNTSAYLAAAASVVARARALFPSAEVSIIGCFKVPNTNDCLAMLKARHAEGLFDAITLHHYGPTNGTVATAATDALRRAATIGAALGDMRAREATVSSRVSPAVPIWLDEFNWGGPWAKTLWPQETHGGLRGLFWASYVLAAIQVTAEARAAGRAGYGALMSYSLFYQASSDWSHWASCATVPDAAGRADGVLFDGVAQIFSHFSAVALSSGHTRVAALTDLSNATMPQAVPGAAGTPCVLAAQFTGAAALVATIVALNSCPFEVSIDIDLGMRMRNGSGTSSSSRGATVTTYSGFDVGGFVLADNISSLDSHPWHNGPLKPTLEAGMPYSMEPISLSFVTVTA